MDIFFIQSFDLTTTPSRMIEAAPIDRTIYITERDNQSYISYGDWTGTSNRIGIGPSVFVLPAGEELWGGSYASSVTSIVEIMATPVHDTK